MEATALNLGALVSSYRVNRHDDGLEEVIMQLESLHGVVSELAARQEHAVLV